MPHENNCMQCELLSFINVSCKRTFNAKESFSFCLYNVKNSILMILSMGYTWKSGSRILLAIKRLRIVKSSYGHYVFNRDSGKLYVLYVF